MSLNTPVYVAGFERGVRPSGLWCVYNLVYVFQSFDALVWHGLFQRAIEVLAENWLQSLVYQGGFSRSADTGHEY